MGGKQSCTSHVCLDLNEPVRSVWFSVLFFESLVFLPELTTCLNPHTRRYLLLVPRKIVELVNMIGVCTTFPNPNGLFQVMPVEIYDYMYKLTQVTVIIISKVRGLKLVFVATCRWTSSKAVSPPWQGLLDVTGVPGVLLVMLSSAIKQQGGFTYLAACLLLETDNLFLVENILTILIDQGIFYSSTPNKSLFYFYVF